MKNVFDNIDRLKAELDSLLPLDKDINGRLQKKIRLEFNYNSNHIEGNTLTYGETQLLLIYGKVSGDFDIRELDEMKAHDVAYSKIVEWAKDEERDITETDIKTLNELILIRPFWKEALTADGQPTRRKIQVGEYKEHANSVRLQNGEIFHYASVIETPMKMQELMSWYNQQKTVLHPVQLAAEFHHKFVLIHPFDDGNGRIARLIVNYILLRRGYPPIIIKSADKKNYLLALNKADTGDLTAFITYIGDQLTWTLDLYISAAKGETIEEDGDWKKELSLLKKVSLNPPVKRTVKNSQDLFQYCIIPLLRKLKEELESGFSELFFEKSFSFQNSRKVSYKALIENKEIQTIKNTAVGTENYKEFTAFFKFLKYKNNGVNIFDINFEIKIKLFEFEYEISSFPEIGIGLKNRIDIYFDSNYINQAVNKTGACLLKQIKIKSQKNSIE